ncbi:MAG: beta-ketoacyl synthase N-terminal-like domain-containing protein [Pirellulales bacterium]
MGSVVEHVKAVDRAAAKAESQGLKMQSWGARAGGYAGQEHSKPDVTARRRVVVTGMGVVTPIGLDVPEFWASIKAGKCGVSRIENFPLEDL